MTGVANLANIASYAGICRSDDPTWGSCGADGRAEFADGRTTRPTEVDYAAKNAFLNRSDRGQKGIQDADRKRQAGPRRRTGHMFHG